MAPLSVEHDIATAVFFAHVPCNPRALMGHSALSCNPLHKLPRKPRDAVKYDNGLRVSQSVLSLIP
jgi:hypothetical protein